MRGHRSLALFTSTIVIAFCLVALATPARGADTPRRGGILLAAIAADAPSLDPHQEETFATLQLVAPCYSTLLQIDPSSGGSQTIGTPSIPTGIAAADGRIWVTYGFNADPGRRLDVLRLSDLVLTSAGADVRSVPHFAGGLLDPCPGGRRDAWTS